MSSTNSKEMPCLKEHVALDRTSWSITSVCNLFLSNAYGWKYVLKAVEYNNPHNHSKLHGFPFTSRTNIYGSQKFDSHKWPTVLVDEVKNKTTQFQGIFV